MDQQRRAFTLVELLAVITIVGAVSALALPAVLSMARERAIQDAARQVHGALSAARDMAAAAGEARGLRFQADPSDPTVCSRLVPVSYRDDYSSGLLATTDPATMPAAVRPGFPCLVVEGVPYGPDGAPVEPVGWWGNVRVGDRLRIGGVGIEYVVVGPVALDTAEGFTSGIPFDRGDGPREFLWLANGADDDHDGFADSGWDGLDNDGDGMTDEADEWEAETWMRPTTVSSAYVIKRRPYPTTGGVATVLPSRVVLDLADLPSEVMIHPDGRVSVSSIYGVPSALGLGDHDIVLRLRELGIEGNEATIRLNRLTGRAATD